MNNAQTPMNRPESIRQIAGDLTPTGDRMPALFVGHGSPMNGIEDNEFSRRWRQLASEIPTPRAVLVVSAHWLTEGTHVTAMQQPQTIHDFGGFPRELYEVQYPAPGDEALAAETRETIRSTSVELNHDWGLDHGAWTIVRHMYPDADIPVLQLSIDFKRPPEHHYELGRELATLRRKGVLIIGSGNMVHNLRRIAWDRLDDHEFGYDWAIEMNETFKKKLLGREHRGLVNYQELGEAVRLAVPTPDHYYPLLYIIGMQEKREDLSLFNDRAVAGSLTMTSVRIG